MAAVTSDLVLVEADGKCQFLVCNIIQNYKAKTISSLILFITICWILAFHSHCGIVGSYHVWGSVMVGFVIAFHPESRATGKLRVSF